MSNSSHPSSDDDYFRAQVRKAADPGATARSDIDVDELVAAMAELATQYPDWREHIAYDVAVDFKGNEELQAQYGAHLDSCELCQGLVETFDPPQNLLDEILTEVRRQPAGDFPVEQDKDSFAAVHEAIEALVRRLFGPGRRFEPVPVPLAKGFGGVLQPALLATLDSAEQSKDPLDRFGVAELYLKYYRPELAYRALGQGLEMCGLEHATAERIMNAASLGEVGPGYLLGIAQELREPASGQDDPLVAVEMNAKLGDHFAAIHQIEMIVAEQDIKWDADSAGGSPVQVRL